MNMTNRESHFEENDLLEDRLHRYGNTLDSALESARHTAQDAVLATDRVAQPWTHNAETSDLLQHPKPKRKARYVVGTIFAGLSALVVSGLSLGGASNTTIVTADPPPSKTASQSKATEKAHLVDVHRITVSSAIAARLTSLLDAAKADGFERISGGGYRSPAAQVALRKAHCGKTDYDIYVKPSSQCSPPTARPGNNEHERGLAVDFTQGGRIVGKDNPFALWLTKNAPKYGFSGIAEEPWHWSAETATSPKPKPQIGETIGTLQIERARINVPLIEGAGPEQIKKGAGREQRSTQLGEAGETVIRCHRTAYGAPCFNLDLVKLGDKISVRTGPVIYEYSVRTVFVGDSTVANTVTNAGISTQTFSIPGLKGHALLTLTTQHPKYSMKQHLTLQAELSGLSYTDPLYLDVGSLK
jgi:LPXTG-site transpeptidase (sortase) family protein